MNFYINGDKKFGISTKYIGPIDEKENLEKHLEQYSIKQLYARHTDHVEELVQKKLYYTFDKKWELLNLYKGKLFKTPEEVERFIVGNYTTPKDHLKRPLAKFQTDIAKQLKLI